MKSQSRRWNSPRTRKNTRSGLWSILGLLLLSACAWGPTGSAYRPTLPQLEAVPLERPCLRERVSDGAQVTTTCVLVLKSDYAAIVRELKASCLALGWGRTYCQTEEAPP